MRSLPNLRYTTAAGLALLLSGGGLVQCGQGRVSEGFAFTDTGLRSTQKAEQDLNALLANKLISYSLLDSTALGPNFPGDLRRVLQAEQAYRYFLDSLRTEILREAGLSMQEPLERQSLQPGASVIRQVLLDGEPNNLLHIAERTGRLRTMMLQLTNYDQPFEAALPLDFQATVDGRYHLWKQAGNCRDLPLTGALALLSNLQSQAGASTCWMLNYCLEKAHPFRWRCFEKFTPAVSARTDYVLPGEHYEADVFFSFNLSDDLQIIEAQINGEPWAVKNGVLHYQTTKTSVGKNTLRVNILATKIRETRLRFVRDTFRTSKEFTYFVGEPFASIHLSDSNYYLYAGIENPVTFSGPVTDHPSVDGATLKALGEGHYALIPKSLQPVYVRDYQLEIKFFVRPLPDPIPLLNGHPSGSALHRDSLAAATALTVRFPGDFDFQAACSIMDFELTHFRPREDPEAADNRGPEFQENVRNLVKTAQSGDRLLFENIRVQCPGDREPRTISALSLRIR